MSAAFYMAAIPAYIVVIVVAILIDWFAAMKIENASIGTKRAWLWFSVLLTCGLLFVFKYQAFALENMNNLLSGIGMHVRLRPLPWPLPIGLSFHTFQSLAYVIEVYRGRQKVERNVWTYASYVIFWPQLVAGPIERPQNLLGQMKEFKTFDRTEAVRGLRLMMLGFFKKLVIANQLALLVNPVYAHPANQGGGMLLLATVAFALQIYGDFSGYSDIARGAAQVIGFRLSENFKHPYGAVTLGDFWNRWHISLYSWFRDYVYIPLGGSRGGTWIFMRNIMVVFLLSGLWHGASWHFVVWGGLNGMGLLIQRLWNRTGICLPHLLARVITLAFVGWAWIFFRADSFSYALLICKSILYSIGGIFASHSIHTEVARFILDMGRLEDADSFLVPALLGTLLLAFYETWRTHLKLSARMEFMPRPARWAAYAVFVLLILSLGGFGGSPFIYFQF